MKRYLSIFLFFFTNVLFGQNGNSKWSISIQQSLDGTYRMTSSKDDLNWLKNQVDSTEIWKAGYTSSIQVNYQLNRHFSFASGLNYELKGEQLKGKALLDMKYYKISYRFIGIPMLLNYSHALEKGFFIFGIGPECLIYLGTTADYQMNSSNTNVRIPVSNGNSRRLQLGSVVKLGYEVNFYKSFRLQLSTVYSQQLLPISNTDLKRKPFSVGFQVGLIKNI